MWLQTKLPPFRLCLLRFTSTKRPLTNPSTVRKEVNAMNIVTNRIIRIDMFLGFDYFEKTNIISILEGGPSGFIN
jgi:hypothetical protein